MQNNSQAYNYLNILHEKRVSNISLEDIPRDLAKIVKISDPSVWPVLMTMNEIMNAVNLPWQSIANEVGIIVIGNAFPKHYTQKIISELETKTRVSPLNFINANAGAAISICCTTYKFQGPTINLTLSNHKRELIATILAKQWLTNGDAKYIFLIIMDFNSNDECVVTNKLIELNSCN